MEPTTVKARPSWFKVPERFEAPNQMGETSLHAFFDLAPFASLDDLEINFVVLSPIGSSYRYELDLVSGKQYLQTPYCSRRDAWENYGGRLNVPNFTEGFIPRLLDKRGTPQEVIVFGRRRYLGPTASYPDRSQRVRIVGGIVEQECTRGNCKGAGGWSDRLILIGVNPLDPQFKDVTNLLGLKKKVDWEYTKAFLSNRKGTLKVGTEYMPGFRAVSEVNSRAAFKMAIQEGHYFKFEELESLRLNCLKLYDHVWNELLRVEESTQEARSLRAENLRVRTSLGSVKRKNIFSDNVISSEREDLEAAEQVGKEGQLSFEKMWKKMVSEQGDRLLTCQRWVRPADLRVNSRRHWSFSYLFAFLEAQKQGHYFDCSRRTWMENPVRLGGKLTYDPVKMLASCTSDDLDEAFDRAITLLTGIQRSGVPAIRYIGHDSGVGGSGERLHSWVKDNGKKFSCVPQAHYDRVSVFPADLSWKSLGWIKTWSRDDLIR